MFAELRPKMMRYTSLDDITTALVELEEKERLAKNVANGVEENGADDARTGMGDSDSYSDRSSIKEADELLSEGNDEGSESINGDDEDEDAGLGRSEEDEVAVRKKRAEVDPAEMEDFDREFKAMLQVKLYDPSFLMQSTDATDPYLMYYVEDYVCAGQILVPDQCDLSMLCSYYIHVFKMFVDLVFSVVHGMNYHICWC